MSKLKLAAIAVFLSVLGTAAIAASVSIQLERGAFQVTGWNAPGTEPARGWSSVFAVYSGGADLPPLLGTYSVTSGALVFRPRFPFAAGVHYLAVFRPPGGGPPVQKVFEGPPRPVTSVARVESVYPSADVLPSNQLRLYIYFSAPMSRGEAGNRIHLLDDRGEVLPGIFLPGEELWDPEFRRLTMTFDPGRIKRGLTSNEAMGPPIVEGKRYTLVIDRDWPDARGVTMLEGFRKTFRGGPAERRPPDPRHWRVTAPKAGTSDAVLLDFPSPMNYPLLQRMIHVVDAHGNVGGKVEISKHETEWRFIPREIWTTGGYRLIVDTRLEDLAGNHIGEAFDIDTFNHVTQHIESNTISLPFAIR